MDANTQTARPSTSTSTSTSTDNFTAIFNIALAEYQRVTGKRLDTQPFAAQLDACDSPKAVSDLLQTQAQAFGRFRQGDERLMAWLNPTVHILSAFSGTLGEGIGLAFSPAKTIFTGIGVLLQAVGDVAASHDAIVDLFERIHLFLQRLNRYNGIPLTEDLIELLGKIMAQLLSILALSTKAMVDRRLKKFVRRLAGRNEIEDAVLRLDALTKEENLMIVARNFEITHRVDENVEATKALTEDVGDNVKVINALAEDIGDSVKATKALTEDVGNNVKVINQNLKATRDVTYEVQWNQLQEKVRTWLSPPNPSVNHNLAREIHHNGTAEWFIQGDRFREWKENGSLLWISGNPGVGKSIFCSAIIEDIKSTRGTRSALVAYYYFDYKDSSKRDIRGLLASLLFQLGRTSDRCWDVLFQLYAACGYGFDQPSTAALASYFKTMLKLPEQLPIFIILDALDECPSTTETPSAREAVLKFVGDIVGSRHSNLFICITSRPEQDIQSVLNPLTSSSRRVSLHEEVGQSEDIIRYLHSFVQTDCTMQRWKDEDKELVINTLSERANGMFRWVFCQLDTLRRCMPSSLRRALNELPTTLDQTYERALQGIPKERRQHAHRLFQCLVAAARPLLAEELAEIFAIDFDQDAICNFMEGWRVENPEEAVLSTCSTLISVIDDKVSKTIQFSHFSVKEFLISDRLRTSGVGSIRDYYVPLNSAHTVLAQACLVVLMQVDVDTKGRFLRRFPLASYAAESWVGHAKYEDVTSQVQRSMEDFFNPQKRHLAIWILMWDVAKEWFGKFTIHADLRSSYSWAQKGAALTYAALCGLSGVANYLIVTHAEDVNAQYRGLGTPLHLASGLGHVEVVYLLLQHNANVNVKCRGYFNWTPLHFASNFGHVTVVQLLLEHGANVNAQSTGRTSPLWFASGNGHVEVVRLLLGGGAEVPRNAFDRPSYYRATAEQRVEIERLFSEHDAERE